MKNNEFFAVNISGPTSSIFSMFPILDNYVFPVGVEILKNRGNMHINLSLSSLCFRFTSGSEVGVSASLLECFLLTGTALVVCDTMNSIHFH